MNTYSFKPHTRHFIGHVCTGEFAEAKAILAAHPSVVTDRNSSGESPLHWLAIEDELEGADMLLNHGADPNSRDLDGTPVISDVASLNNVRLVRRLIAAGVDVCARHSRNAETALHAVARHASEPSIVDLLVDAGADVDARNHIIDDTPLFEAASFDNQIIAARLIARGANVAIVNDLGNTMAANAPKESRAVWEELVQDSKRGADGE